MADHPIKPLPPPETAWSSRETQELASRAIGKVCRDDVRGATMLSVDEIMAMTGVLIGFGLIATLPGQVAPKTLILTPRKEA